MKNKLIKFGLLGLSILSLGIACFSSAGYDYITGGVITDFSVSKVVIVSPVSLSASDKLCISGSVSGNLASRFDFQLSSYTWYDASAPYVHFVLYKNSMDFFGCLQPMAVSSNKNFIFGNFSSNNGFTNITYNIFKLTDSCDCPTCPNQYTSLECQTEYNLIPISSVDQNYCESNNLCEVCEDIPEFTGTLSNLYINDIFHLGAPIIQMNIPEEIDWDYAYTNSGYNMNIDIVGYNQDTEYINGLIDVQNYKPTSEDFTKVFMNFSNYGGLLIATLFVILVFYFVKKMFK